MVIGNYFVYLLLLAVSGCLCQHKNQIRIGVFFNADQKNITYWDAIKELLPETVELVTSPNEIEIVPENDAFSTQKQFCNFIQKTKNERLMAVIGPKSLTASTMIESICEHLAVPYISTSPKPPSVKETPYSISLYPEFRMLSKALAKIVESFDWTSFIILYEDEEGLLKLQDVMKLTHKNKEAKNEHKFFKLIIGGDNRQALKMVRNSNINWIILDCHVDRIASYFEEARNVDLLSDLSRSFFLTSLDAHTMDYTQFIKELNITTIRLFNPAHPVFNRVASRYFDSPKISLNNITVEQALVLDAMLLIGETVNQLKAQNKYLSPRRISCHSNSRYQDSLSIIQEMQEVQLNEVLTGSKLSFASGSRDEFTLQVIELNSKDSPIAIWNSEDPDNIELTRNETEREAEFKRRIAEHNFIVSSRILEPYLMEDPNPDAYKNAKYYGYCMDLMTEISKIANLSFEFRITKDNSPANVVNDLVERRADLGIMDFTITPQRREVIDFSLSFMKLGIGILHQKPIPEESNNKYAFMRPISWTVWFYIWTLSLINSITMFFVARMAPAEWENPKPWDPESKELENIWTVKNFLWLCLGSITAQGCDILPKSVPARVIGGSWWFFALIIISSYTANLAAFLTYEKQDVVIDSVEELAAQSKIKYGLMSKGSTEQFFSSSNDSLYGRLWNNMKNEKPSVFETDNPSGVERVKVTKKGLYAFFMESTGIEYELGKSCNLRKIGGLLDSKSYGIGMPLNAPYRNMINHAILTLQESGKLQQIKNKWWKEMVRGEPCPEDPKQSASLALSNVGGIFDVLGIGIGIAYAIAVIEFLWNVRQLSIEEHLSYMETLKCEIKFACNIFQKKKRAKPVPSESSSSKSSLSDQHEKISIARSIFSKSASLLNLSTHDEHRPDASQVRQRSRSKVSNNHLRVS
ncbi:glutamate receptor ionotropic, kainate 2-like [Anthonomus grandis grandis]|uniref:glutamate receptor ionotropic, kainate 2-like n=1 Tax=Anthonomus grandis grandis TaxID=2921223 RepID=UPI0021651CE6|nr:glutamate receptor ionotropic, kainate 2-like [Anthonomus grandis grandis]